MVNVQTNPIKEKEITNIIELNKVIENTIKLINQGSSTIDFEEKVLKNLRKILLSFKKEKIKNSSVIYKENFNNLIVKINKQKIDKKKIQEIINHETSEILNILTIPNWGKKKFNKEIEKGLKEKKTFEEKLLFLFEEIEKKDDKKMTKDFLDKNKDILETMEKTMELKYSNILKNGINKLNKIIKKRNKINPKVNRKKTIFAKLTNVRNIEVSSIKRAIEEVKETGGILKERTNKKINNFKQTKVGKSMSFGWNITKDTTKITKDVAVLGSKIASPILKGGVLGLSNIVEGLKAINNTKNKIANDITNSKPKGTFDSNTPSY